MEGKPNQLYAQGMRSFEQYDEARKYFAEERLANDAQAQLQLYDISLGEYLVNKYTLWLDFRKIDENELHGMGRRIENASEGITLQIEKKEESAGALNAYIYLIMDAQLNIQNDAYVSAIYYILALGVIGGLGYYIYRTKKGQAGEVKDSSTTRNPTVSQQPSTKANKFEMD